ncbi:MAG: hypothetical protein AB7V77_04145 [Candidatus Woesearchaeota archaeon]
MANITITSDDILGKMALDPSGDILGIVTQLHIDKQKKKITGITVDQGFGKPDLFVGLEYVENFGVDVVFLNKIPFVKIKGLNILSHDGDILGFVEDVIVENHNIVDVVMRKNKLSSKRELISGKHIEFIGEDIILKKHFKKKPYN